MAGMSQSSRLAELQEEFRHLVHSWEFAFAMGHSRTMGAPDPRLQPVLDRYDELSREIAALKRGDLR
jgi:hypothetical protein